MHGLHDAPMGHEAGSGQVTRRRVVYETRRSGTCRKGSSPWSYAMLCYPMLCYAMLACWKGSSFRSSREPARAREASGLSPSRVTT